MSLINVAFAQTENPSGIISAIDRIVPGGIDNIFGLGLGIGAILAIGTVIYAGIIYASSGDNSSKQKDAKAWIVAAVKGLALIAGGFLILTMVNPNIVKVEEILIKDLPVPEINVQPTTEYIAPEDFPGGINWKGQYDSNTSYSYGDAVSYYGVSFVAYKSTKGILPSNNSRWKVLTSSPITEEDSDDPPSEDDPVDPPPSGGDSTYTEVPLLKQGSSPWGNKSYGNCGSSGTYALAGCGPTSVAMAVIYLTGNNYMTKNTAVESVGSAMVSGGYRPCGNGTSGSGIKNVPKRYGLSSSEISGRSGITSCLKKNGVIVALMRGATASEQAALKNTPRDRTPIFTTAGHYIVVKGINESVNRVYINDSAGRNVQSSEIQHFLNFNRTMWCIKK
jgi:hypothetical protein